jgi:hypothetical protein
LRRYAYVGPEHVRLAAVGAARGSELRSAGDAARWVEGATYVVALDGVMRVADRRSEHVACAGGAEVLAAGEIWFDRSGAVVEVSNLSTGYCPEPTCWDAVAQALALAHLTPPRGFTRAHEFRRCEACGERNLVKDEHFVCAVCDAELPARWNFSSDS